MGDHWTEAMDKNQLRNLERIISTLGNTLMDKLARNWRVSDENNQI